MKLKIIIFPFVLIMTIILSVNFIYPEYQEIQKLTEEIKSKNNFLSDLQQKNRNVKSLVEDLESNSSMRDFVMNYLPEKKNEEDIIDRSNYLAIDSGALLSLVDLEKPIEPVAEQVAADEKAIADRNAMLSGNVNKGQTIQVQPEPPVKVSYIGSTVELVGTYENIKSYLNKYYRIENWFEINSLEIKQADIDDEGQEGNAEGENQAEPAKNQSKNLEVSYSLNFGYLPTTKIKINQVPQIFEKSEFDFSPAEKAKEICTSSIPQIDPGSYGNRVDPFFP